MTDDTPIPEKPKKGNPFRRREEIKQSDRRTQILKLYMEHFTQEQIATALGVNQSTVSRDIAALEGEWKKERQRDIEDHKARMLADLEEMENRTLQRSAAGDPREIEWQRLRLLIIERKAKLLGTDAPKQLQVEPTGVLKLEYVNNWNDVKAE